MGMYGDMARRHWKTFLPSYYAKLVAEGRLEMELAAAEAKTCGELVMLISEQGMRADEAREFVLPHHILLEPEAAARIY